MWAGFAGPIRIGPTGSASASTFANWKAMLAASRFGKIRMLASPFSREVGSTRSRSVSDSAVSACISPSTSSSGARSAMSASAARILCAEAVSAAAEIGVATQRDLGLDAEALDVVGAGDRHLGDLLGGRVRADMGVGEEEGALRGDHAGVSAAKSCAPGASPMMSRMWRRCRSKRPSRPQIMASASPRCTASARDHGRCWCARCVRAASGVTPLRPASASTVARDIVAVARVVLGIDELEVAPGGDREAEALEPRLDDAAAGRSGSAARSPPRAPPARRAARARPRRRHR